MKISTLFFLALASSVLADDKPKTFLGEPGKPIYAETFAGAAVPEGWRAAKGKWEPGDGALKGTEIKADMHGAAIRKPVKFKDVVIAFDVKLDGARIASFSINDAKEHVARMLFSATGFTVQKDDHDHDGPDEAAVFGKVAKPLKAGEWHTAVIEIVGDTMLGSLDGQNATFGSDALIATDKANIGLTVGGESASFRNLRIWEASPKADWAATKAKLSAAKK
jgi:hypothetical protein